MCLLRIPLATYLLSRQGRQGRHIVVTRFAFFGPRPNLARHTRSLSLVACLVSPLVICRFAIPVCKAETHPYFILQPPVCSDDPGKTTPLPLLHIPAAQNPCVSSSTTDGVCFLLFGLSPKLFVPGLPSAIVSGNSPILTGATPPALSRIWTTAWKPELFGLNLRHRQRERQ